MSHRAYVLTTPRLGMRRLVVEDLEPLRAVFADVYAARFYPAMGQTDLRRPGVPAWTMVSCSCRPPRCAQWSIPQTWRRFR